MKKAIWGVVAILILVVLGFLVWNYMNATSTAAPTDAMQNGAASTTAPNGTTGQEVPAGQGDVSGFTYNQQKYVCPDGTAFTTLSNADNSKILLLFTGPKAYSSAILSKVAAANATRYEGGDKAFEMKLGGYTFTVGTNTMRCTRG